jgi:hypothetical protein
MKPSRYRRPALSLSQHGPRALKDAHDLAQRHLRVRLLPRTRPPADAAAPARLPVYERGLAAAAGTARSYPKC